jgi:hypothetical protein
MIVDNLFHDIVRGKNGLNAGLSSGIDKIDKITYGIQRKWFTTIFGDSGSGKSQLSLYTAVYYPFKQLMENPSLNINWLIFSFEMSSEVLLAKLLSLHIYDEYHLVVPYEHILSLRGIISEQEYVLVMKSKPWLEEFEKRCQIIDKPVTSRALYGICKEWSRKFGNYKEIERTDEYLKEDYIPNDPQQYLIVIVDHVSLLSLDSGHTKKQEIDMACEYLIHFRNKCNFTVYVVQQANRNFKSMDRRQGGYQLLQLDDAADSSGPSQASEVVIGIFHPFRERLPTCEKYDIRKLQDRFRLCQVLKQRFGVADRSVGCAFWGEIGYWKDLPLPNEITDYSQYLNP